MKNKKKRKILRPSNIFLLIGILLFAYPVIATRFNSFVDGQLAVGYERQIEEMKKNDKKVDFKKLWKEIDRYNVDLRGNYVVDIAKQDLAGSDQYERLLNFNHDGVMCVLNVPSLNLELPVYHGTSEETLSKGVGHIEGTSLPSEQKDTNPVFSAHRGMADKELFTNLDKMKVGDYFNVKVLDKTIWYKVKSVQTILPEEVHKIQPEKDKCKATLLTCTPIFVNSHRLIVTGEKCDPPSKSELANHSHFQLSQAQKFLILCVSVVGLTLGSQNLYYRHKKNKKKRRDMSEKSCSERH